MDDPDVAANHPLMHRSPSQQMMSQVQARAEASKDGSALPEVVPVENLRHNTIRHDDSWYRGQSSGSYSHGQPQFYDANSVKSSNSTYANASHSPYLQTPESVSGNSWHESTSGALPTRSISQKSSRLRSILFIAVPTFLVTAIILAAALGYPLMQANRNNSPNDYKPLAAVDVNRIDISDYCDSNGKSTRSSTYFGTNGTYSFDVLCGLIIQEMLPALNPDPSASDQVLGTVRNIATIISYTFEDCVYACASLNNLTLNANPKDPACQSVTFVGMMSLAVTGYGGNCFLKNSTVSDLKQAGVDLTAVSAELKGLRSQ